MDREEEIKITPAKSKEELIENYARVQGISLEEALAAPVMQGDTVEEILDNLKKETIRKIQERIPKLNRASRRRKMKEMGKSGREQFAQVSDITTKLQYIDLIQKLRTLNEKKKGEIYEDEDSEESNL